MRLSRQLLYDRATLKTEMLSARVCDLRLRLSGSVLGSCVERALEEAQHFGITLQPHFYLSDGYGCVQGTANVGLGFWDVDEVLREIHRDRRGYSRDAADLVLLLKHEIGHAFCYSHKLFQLREFRKIFGVQGHFFASYPDHNGYRVDPYSNDHVNPDGDNYAQKHPDEDFAETFATFLDRSGAWKERYRGRSGALRKLNYVGRLINTYGGRPPVVAPGTGCIDVPVAEIRQTVAQFFRMSRKRYLRSAGGYFDDDLMEIFRPGSARLLRPTAKAATLLSRQRRFLEASIRTRVRPKDPRVVGDVLEKVRSRLKVLDLVYAKEEQDRTLAEIYGLVLHKVVLFNRFGAFT